MESLKELNKICQKSEYKTKGNWMARNITRDLAIPISWLLLHTKITANQVTLISLIIGLLGEVALCFGSKASMLIGVFLIQLWYVFDHVDGHIARYKKQSSLTGVYFDYVTHYIIHAGIFIGIGVGVWNSLGDAIYMLLGFLAAFGVTFLNLVYDVLYKTYYFQFKKAKGIIVKGNEVSKGEERKAYSGGSLLKQTFSLLHKLCEVHVLMNIVTLVAILQLALNIYPWKIVIASYAIISVLVGILKNVHFILTGAPDKIFADSFEVTE